MLLKPVCATNVVVSFRVSSGTSLWNCWCTLHVPLGAEKHVWKTVPSWARALHTYHAAPPGHGDRLRCSASCFPSLPPTAGSHILPTQSSL